MSEDDGIISKGGKRPPGPPLAPPTVHSAPPGKPDLDAYERGRADERAARDNEVEQWVASVQSLVDRDVVPTMEALFTREPADPTPIPQLQPDWCESCHDRHPPAMCCSFQVGWEKDGELISLNQCNMKYGAKWRSPKWMKAEGWQPVFVRGETR